MQQFLGLGSGCGTLHQEQQAVTSPSPAPERRLQHPQESEGHPAASDTPTPLLHMNQGQGTQGIWVQSDPRLVNAGVCHSPGSWEATEAAVLTPSMAYRWTRTWGRAPGDGQSHRAEVGSPCPFPAAPLQAEPSEV